MICTNPECEKFGEKSTEVVLHIKDGEKRYYCLWCKETIDETNQPVAETPKGPFFKRKNWLNEWKFVNAGRTAEDIKLKPKISE